uniref:Uncharacterized protein n=1 Tax=Oryzias sinensis TaxID=183150 RepID=A0A8C7WVJ1_9TELE
VTCEYIKGEKQFYYRAQKFYEDVPASEEGMMGDFVEISNVDLEGSRQFLKRFVVSGPYIRSPSKTSERLTEPLHAAAHFSPYRLSLNEHVRGYFGQGIHLPDCTKKEISPCLKSILYLSFPFI